MTDLSFEVIEGPDTGRVVEVVGALVIGTGIAAQIRLNDPHVEREHSRVTASGDGVLVEDLGDPGGTFVNDSELRVPARMEAGDELQVGLTVLKLRVGKDAPSEVRPRPPALATGHVPPAYLVPSTVRPAADASELDELLDVRVKRMARHAPLAVFVVVVYAVLIYLATARF